jgi:hypothetical protein
MQSPSSSPSGFRVDLVTALAVACVLVGWFLLSTVVTTLGRIELPFRFYEAPVLIDNPALLFVGIGNEHSLATVSFGLLCVAAAIAPLLPATRTTSFAWLASAAPLLLMALCGLMLYANASSSQFETADDGTIAGQIAGLARDVVGRMAGVVARRISIGFGAYLSLAASIFLAVRGWLVWRRRPAAA